MIRIRLSRGGKKNSPFYRIVTIQKQRKRGGKALETIGFWDPSKKNLKIDKKKLSSWIDKGAQMSESLKILLKNEKIS